MSRAEYTMVVREKGLLQHLIFALCLHFIHTHTHTHTQWLLKRKDCYNIISTTLFRELPLNLKLPLHSELDQSDCKLNVCMHGCMDACVYVCMDVCMHVHMHVCMYVPKTLELPTTC